MPPGPAYNWFCVLHSVTEILGHAARYRGAHVPLKTTPLKLHPDSPLETSKVAENENRFGADDNKHANEVRLHTRDTPSIRNCF
jgi:hypothetical protein